MPASVIRAKELLARRSILFVDIFPSDGETLGEVALALEKIRCHGILHPERGVVTAFPPHSPAISVLFG
jgi:hypothetical protein